MTKKVAIFNGKEYTKNMMCFKSKDAVNKAKIDVKGRGFNAIIDKNKEGYFLWIRKENEKKISKPLVRKVKTIKPKEGLSKTEKEMMIDMYYNDEQKIDSFRSTIKFATGMKPRTSTIENNINNLKKKGLVEGRWYSNIPALSRKRFKEIHYGLTTKGFKMTQNFPRIIREYKEKEREYKEDARRYR